MALTPTANDTEGQAALKAGTYNTGPAASPAPPLLFRVAIITAAKYGLTAHEQGRISNICAQSLAAAGGDPQRVDYAAMRPALVKLLGPV